MKHPSEETLALHAGKDLGVLARWRVERHLARCEQCREEIAIFQSVREIAPDLKEIPEIPWARLSAEMKANIRLGLVAGECVRNDQIPATASPLFSGARAVVAIASVVTLMVTGLVLEHPAPNPTVARQQGVVVQKMARGIQVWEDGRALELKHAVSDEREVFYSVGAQGSMRARYVDPESGYVTINNVYAE